MLISKEKEMPYGDQRSRFFDQEKIVKTLFGNESTEKIPLLAEGAVGWSSGVQFSDSVRAAVASYILPRAVQIKDAHPILKEDSDTGIKEAIVDHVFWGVDTRDKSKELLLLKLGDAVSRIETRTCAEALRSISEGDLGKLGLNPALRGLTVDLLEASPLINTLFIRFMDQGMRHPPHPEKATATSFFIPGESEARTVAGVFPEESLMLSTAISGIAQQQEAWVKEKNGGLFREYLGTIAEFYKETEPRKAALLHGKMSQEYADLLKANFPIVLTPGLLGYYVPPHIDPELKISIISPDAVLEDDLFNHTRDVMADNLGMIGAEEFSKSMRNTHITTAVTLGGYGVNLRYPAPAQSRPSITIFLDEEMRQADREFPKYMNLIVNTKDEFKGYGEEEKIGKMEFMCRMNTVLHELGHLIYPSTGENSQRLGNKATFNIIDEIKVESVYRSMLRTLCRKGGLAQSERQWAIGSLASALQGLTNGEDDVYFPSSVFALNNLFEGNAVKINDGKFEIRNFDLYFQILEEDSAGLLRALYTDPSADEARAAEWIGKAGVPNPYVREAMQLLK